VDLVGDHLKLNEASNTTKHYLPTRAAQEAVKDDKKAIMKQGPF
jgi:hypothetical protein